ncbi:adenylate kinase [bacterium]|nr:adenylate kinase [bacterium]MCI0606042.1 adenylate kinase [bacterium]
MNSIPVIIFLGAPGAGKGTQAEYLSKLLSIPKISTGDMLRSAVQKDSPLGRKVQEIMKEGGLVDDETMLNLIRERISRPDCKDGFILDGYPRNRKQAAQLEEVLPAERRLIVINIQVSEEQVVKRIAGRRTCPKCGNVYNVHFRPPAEDEKCDQEGTLLVRRADDAEEVVRKRIRTYKKETLPLIDYYKKRGVLTAINGVNQRDVVASKIIDAVN